MPTLLAQKRCLIVGGTSGLGLAAARSFIAEGAQIALAGLPDDNLERARAELSVPCFGGDASQSADVEALFANALAALGGLDVLYHVAGISGRRFGDGP